MNASVQIGKRGVLTLPVEIRDRYQIQAGDTFRLIDLEGLLVLAPMTPMTPQLANEIERARIEAGLTIEELLISLREQRERYSVDLPYAA